jgi:hypothetical protein
MIGHKQDVIHKCIPSGALEAVLVSISILCLYNQITWQCVFQIIPHIQATHPSIQANSIF